MASVSGFVFGDYNANGSRDDGEQAAGYGVSVFADLNANGAFDAGEPNGLAASSLPGNPTAFTIRDVPATGTPFQLLVNHVGSSFVTTRAQTVTITSESQAITGRAVGLATDPDTVNVFGRVYSFRVTTGAAFDVEPITGRRVYEDLDNDRVLDAGEPSTLPLADGTYRLNALPNTLGQIRIESTPTSAPELQGSLGILRYSAGVVVDERNLGERTGPGELVIRPYRDSNLSGGIDAGDAPATLASAWIDSNGNKRLDDGETQLAAKPATAGGFRDYAAVVTLGQYPVAYRLAGDADLIADGVVTGKALSEPGPTINATNVDNPTNGAAVYGTVYNDLDRDGVRDAGEAGIGGTTVYADLNYNGARDAGEPSAVTIASGAYGITGIAPQATSVAIRLLDTSATLITAPAGGAHSGRFNAGINYANRNFGVAPYDGTIPASGRAFVDRDGNGVFSSGDVTNVGRVFVDLNFNRVYDAGEPSTMRAADGTFRLLGVPAGQRVSIVAADLEPDVSSSREFITPSGTAAQLSGLQIYLTHPASATIRGRVFSDVNGNGVFGAGDAPIRGQAVYVDLNYNGTFFDEPLGYSDENGFYTIVDVPLSNASAAVRLLRVPTAQVTTPAGGAHSGKFSAAITYANRDFGIRPSAGISGVVFNDVDADGILDSTEPFIGGLTVYADLDGDGLFDPDEPHGLTASHTGAYSFTGIPVRPTVSVQVRLAGISAYRITLPAGGSHSAKFDGAYTRGGVIFGVAPD